MPFGLSSFTFNKKRHDRELIELKQSLDLDVERRKKVFEMKAARYEAYFKHIDEYHRRHQSDYQEKFTPVFNEFMARYLKAEDSGDKAASASAIVWFSERISQITADGFQEYLALESETNSLKLTASDEVAILLEELKDCYSATFELSGEMMRNLVEITITNDKERSESYRSRLQALGSETKAKATKLMAQMRADLKCI